MKLKASRVSLWGRGCLGGAQRAGGLPPVQAPRRTRALRGLGDPGPATPGLRGFPGEVCCLLLPSSELSPSSLSREGERRPLVSIVSKEKGLDLCRETMALKSDSMKGQAFLSYTLPTSAGRCSKRASNRGRYNLQETGTPCSWSPPAWQGLGSLFSVCNHGNSGGRGWARSALVTEFCHSQERPNLLLPAWIVEGREGKPEGH